MFKFLLLAFLLTMTTSIYAQTAPPIETGVSQTLAKWRAANYSDVRYKLNITLEKGAPLMKGEIEVRVNLTDAGAKNDLILDFRATQFQNDKDEPFVNVLAVNESDLTLNRKEFSASLRDEHLIISSLHFKKGENVIKIEFASPIKTSGAAITRYVDKEDGAEYVYSLFVPSDASTAFPVFDQPDLKATFQLNATVPFGWKVINNSAEEDYGSFSRDTNQKIVRREFNFEVTKPISTYVFAFAAGEFTEFRGKTSVDAKYPPDFNESLDKRSAATSRISTTNIYVRKSQAEKFKAHEKEVFRLNSEAVKYLESYFDYKFPFPKYDLVLLPEFPFGGMEHAGATFLREDRVIFPTEPTKNDFVTRANLIFHEAAHQWFGDTVTMRWFDDLWLKEGFAEFMAYKTLEKVMPEYNSWKIFYERNKQAAYLTDSTKGTTPIYQEIPNLNSAKSAYGNIVYRKAPSFLKQAEFYLGADKFQTAVRAFLKKHQFANAEWTDLVKEFETASGHDLKDWAKQWINQRGLAKIEFYDAPTSVPRIIANQQNILGDGSKWTQKVKFLLIDRQNNRQINDVNFNIWVKKETPSIWQDEAMIYERRGLDNYPIAVFPNYQDYGYGIFLLDEKSRDYVQKNIQNEKDDFLRTMMWGSLWDSVREAELAPADYVRLVIKNIAVETDESTIQTLLGRVSTALNYYLSDKQRDEVAAQIEMLLIDRMQTAPTLGQRITFYRAFLSIGSTQLASTALKDMLKGKGIRDFTFKTKDKFDILTKLAILGNLDTSQKLTELLKTETSDEAKRYAYAVVAGFPDREAKDKYFNDFLNNKEISESWIEAAFIPFNSSRHSELTLPYLEKALAELPNLKKNRKIFFVGGWLGAFIGGQKSEQALSIVNKFLADNPNLDKDLRLKILENADNLERAVKIRRKFVS